MWSLAEFEARIWAVGERSFPHRHPFNVRMHAGELSKEEFKGWVLNRFYYQFNLPVTDALILAKLPSREQRRWWVTRIIDHDGRVEGEGRIESWLRLGAAVGISRDELLSCARVLPGVRSAVDTYVYFCRTRPWLEAIASALTDRFAPELLAGRNHDLPKHYAWIDSAGLDCFRARPPEETEQVLQLVLFAARSHDDQRRCIDALEFTCDMLWALFDAVERSYRTDRVDVT